MDHREYIREVPGAATAFVFIHGILGTPNHFDDLIPLVPANCSVYNLLLDGHGGSVMDFARSSMGKWKAQVELLYERIRARYEKIVFVGHSMGTLFAIQMALVHPEQIPFVFLLACPVKLWLRPTMIVNSLRVALGKIDDTDPRQAATANATSIRTDRRLILYVTWAPRFLELLREIRLTSKLLPGLEIPVYAVQSARDEMVSKAAARVLEERGGISVMRLPESGHYYYSPADKATMQELFSSLCETYL